MQELFNVVRFITSLRSAGFFILPLDKICTCKHLINLDKKAFSAAEIQTVESYFWKLNLYPLREIDVMILVSRSDNYNLANIYTK